MGLVGSRAGALQVRVLWVNTVSVVLFLCARRNRVQAGLSRSSLFLLTVIHFISADKRGESDDDLKPKTRGYQSALRRGVEDNLSASDIFA